MNWDVVAIFGLCVFGFLSIITFACMMASLEHGTLRESRRWFALFAGVLIVDAVLVGVVF